MLAGVIVAAVVPELPLVITPGLVLAVLVPGLVFEAAYRLQWSHLQRSLVLITVLAVPGVLISAAVVAVVLSLTGALPLGLAFIVGAMLAATDPVAVVSTFRRLHAPERLATIVEGESLLNDGTGLILLAVAVRGVQGHTDPAGAVVAFLATIAVSVVVGVIGGFVAARLIVLADDRPIEITISIVLAYGAYLIADAFGLSGIVATVVAGVMLRRGIDQGPRTADTIEALDTVWGYVAFALTAIVFLVVGLKITPIGLLGVTGAIAWGTFGILAGRAVIVYGIVGGLSSLNRRLRGAAHFPLRWRHVVFWSGLRGAIAVAAALSLPLDFPERALLQQITFGVVLVTLLVQGGSARLVIRAALGPNGDGEPTA